MPRHQLTQHLPLSTYALLRVLSVEPCDLFSRMCLHTVDSARDVSNDQWAVSMPFHCLFNVPFGFL